MARENLGALRSEGVLESRSLVEEKLVMGDGGVRGGGMAMACWLRAGGRGRADVGRGRASRARRRKMRSFMVSGG